MNYPNTISEVRASIQSYAPTIAETSAAVERAANERSIVDASVGVFDALSPHVDDLDADGLRVLVGCARLIDKNGYYGKGEEAFAVFARVAPMLPAGNDAFDPE